MFFKPKPMIEVAAPITGIAEQLSQVPDPIFAGKIVGDGIAVIPTGSEVVAPFDCEVIQIAHTLHAIAVRSKEGIEFLIHMGIDTVQMKEKAYDYCVRVGEKVSKGEMLLRVDWELIQRSGYPTVSPCIILNYQKVKQTKFFYGEVVAGSSKIMEISC